MASSTKIRDHEIHHFKPPVSASGLDVTRGNGRARRTITEVLPVMGIDRLPVLPVADPDRLILPVPWEPHFGQWYGVEFIK